MCCCEVDQHNLSDEVGHVPQVTGHCVAVRQAVQANTGPHVLNMSDRNAKCEPWSVKKQQHHDTTKTLIYVYKKNTESRARQSRVINFVYLLILYLFIEMPHSLYI